MMMIDLCTVYYFYESENIFNNFFLRKRRLVHFMQLHQLFLTNECYA